MSPDPAPATDDLRPWAAKTAVLQGLKLDDVLLDEVVAFVVIAWEMASILPNESDIA